MEIDVSRFRAAFYVEAGEHLQAMEAALLQLEAAPRDTELLNTIFRAAHSIKGASTTFGIDEVGRFTHVLENLLERLRDGLLETDNALIELLLTSVDVISDLVANAKDGVALPENLEEVLNELKRANGQSNDSATPPSTIPSTNEIATDGVAAQRYRITITPSRDFFRFGQDPLLLLRELSELGSLTKVVVDDECLPSLSAIEPEDCYLSWTVELETTEPESSLQNVFMFLDDQSKYLIDAIAEAERTSSCTTEDAQAVSGDSRLDHKPSSDTPTAANAPDDRRTNPDRRNATTVQANAVAETVRVDRQLLDELINQIGEIVIGASMVSQDMHSLSGGRTFESVTALEKTVRDLQEMSLGLRMVPIGATFQKMNRVVRDVAKKLGKQIQFITEGDDTELDKSVVDQISDPLVHMVRNAADHGIETPEERVASGKSSEGSVKLRAYQQGGNVYIELHDDGRGLNRKRILEKAVERGLVAVDATPTDSEVCNLIFQPGFSTAAEVTDVSGRGVGMDVVRRNVEALQGSVSIQSVEGKGSKLTVRLPLTLAILDGLLVRLANEVFVIPLLSVVESICVQTKEFKQIVGVAEVIQLRGEVVPVIRLHRALNISDSLNAGDPGLVVIVEDQGRRYALKVDELLGQQQVVIKNLETNFRKVPGVAGATILGDGRVALILDVYGISNLPCSEFSDFPIIEAVKTATQPNDEG
jgi:two-component system chemotaxis sensor kinase CheA